MRRHTALAAAALTLVALAGCGDTADAADETARTAAPEYEPTAEEQEFIDAVHSVLEVNGGGVDGPAGRVLEEVRYTSTADAVDLVTTWSEQSDVDQNIAETLCAVVELAEVKSQDVLATSSIGARVLSKTGTPLHTCS